MRFIYKYTIRDEELVYLFCKPVIIKAINRSALSDYFLIPEIRYKNAICEDISDT